MSSADPINLTSPSSAPGSTLARGRSSEKRPADTADPTLREDTDVRSEKPRTIPEDRKADRKPPQSDQAQEPDPKGVRGAFRKHPIAMVACLGLILAGRHCRHRMVPSCSSLREHG